MYHRKQKNSLRGESGMVLSDIE